MPYWASFVSKYNWLVPVFSRTGVKPEIKSQARVIAYLCCTRGLALQQQYRRYRCPSICHVDWEAPQRVGLWPLPVLRRKGIHRISTLAVEQA